MHETVAGFAGPWSQLNPPLTPWVLDVLRTFNFTQMTPVQASTIPLFMGHKDVVVEAVTGSGKTLAFIIPILERLLRREEPLKCNEIGALIISPTRELATQIFSVLSQFIKLAPEGTHLPEALLLVSGMASAPAQDVSRFLETSCDIVIGTPGRIEEFLLGKGSKHVSAKELEVLVLDEADRLLDLGFTGSITRILQLLPKQRRTGLFSATMTDALSELVRVGLRNPVRVIVKVEAKKMAGIKRKSSEVVEERRTPASLRNGFIHCHAEEKTQKLIGVLKHESTHSANKFIVYFATCATVEYFYRIFTRLPCLRSFDFFSLHGHLPPAKRDQVLANFTAYPPTIGKSGVLLCTDVAARGIDLPDVDVVIQYDCPTDTKTFSHRAGRTARMGREGQAWVLLVGNELDYVDLLRVRKIPVKEESLDAVLGQDEKGNGPDVLLSDMRKLVLQDRDLHDKGMKAFVSFVRAYSKHEASYIFKVKDLDLVGIAKSFGLLRLPRMPELKDRMENWTDAEIDWETYGYLDKVRESKRLTESESQIQKLREEKASVRQKKKEQKTKNASWSEKVELKESRDKRREKRARKRKREKEEEAERVMEDEASKDEMEDWQELVKEERLARKTKRAKLIAAGDSRAFIGL